LRGADNDLLQCLSECALNVLKGNVDLTPSEKAKLTKYKQKLRKVANKKVPLKQKHKIVQTGGFVPALLAPVVKAVVVPLIGKAIGSVVTGLVKKVKKTPRRFLFR
jgi:F0F1-type ATP synthase beta subunit